MTIMTVVDFLGFQVYFLFHIPLFIH